MFNINKPEGHDGKGDDVVNDDNVKRASDDHRDDRNQHQDESLQQVDVQHQDVPEKLASTDYQSSSPMNLAIVVHPLHLMSDSQFFIPERLLPSQISVARIGVNFIMQGLWYVCGCIC